MHQKILLIALSLIISTMAVAQQKPATYEEKFEQAYQKRIKKERLYGVYIPKDLTDCFIQLNRLIDNKSKQKYKYALEGEVTKKLHFSLGRWIIYNWNFYEGSRLSHYLNGLGITQPDDMAHFIMITYHRNLNKKELKVKNLVNSFLEKQKMETEARKKKGTVIHSEKRKRTKD